MNTLDWMPRNHEELVNQASRTVAYIGVVANRDRLGFANTTPPGRWYAGTFFPKWTAFNNAFNQWKNPATRTPLMTETLKEAEKNFQVVYRQLYAGFLSKNPVVTDTDLVGMGFHARPTVHHTPVPAPTTVPETEVKFPAAGVIVIHFHDEGSTHRGKPAGVHGAEIRWTLSETPITKWEDLTHSEFDTASPFKLSFEADECGKKLWYAVRWENTRGEKGPWTRIAMTVIP